VRNAYAQVNENSEGSAGASAQIAHPLIGGCATCARLGAFRGRYRPHTSHSCAICAFCATANLHGEEAIENHDRRAEKAAFDERGSPLIRGDR
jgi:hypothetical protein